MWLRNPQTHRSWLPATGAGLLLTLLLTVAGLPGDAAREPTFEKDILPLLEAQCFQCHGEKTRLSGLDLRTPGAMVKGGVKGAAISPGAARNSLLYKRVADGSMPPGDDRLSKVQVELIREWLDAGAPAEKAENSLQAKKDPRNHWAFQSPQRPAIPAVRKKWWVLSPIDAFVLAKLEAKGIDPPPAADRRTLLRRVYLDLIGLPPTPEAQVAFLSDESPNAFEKVVDDLLSRDQYGERWARHWLDVVRYAETNGYERDGNKPNAWRYRDYVIDAFNHDKPYDRFLTEQLAGDEVEGSNAETQIATTFLRLGTWDDEPADPLVDRYEQLDDMLGTTAATFMAITIRCARCHDHKFEPFTQQDYYSLLSVFSPLKRPQNGRTDLDRLVGTEAELNAYHQATARIDERLKPVHADLDAARLPVIDRLVAQEKTDLPKEAIAAFLTPTAKRDRGQRARVRRHEQKFREDLRAIATSEEKARLDEIHRRIEAVNGDRPPEPPRGYIWYEDTPEAKATHLLTRGDPRTPAEEVATGMPPVLLTKQPAAPTPQQKSTGRRLWLANWLTRADNPLTGRVMVNRIWQHHFGDGLVSSENDFGVMGLPPTHPELLDWLATEFVRSGWSVKKLHRLIVLSNTYKATADWSPKAADPVEDAPLLYRWRPRRLEAEAIRDSMLAVSGQLNLKVGGSSMYPKLPPGVLASQSRPGTGWGRSDEREAARRSIYIYVKRSLGVPELELLDAPNNNDSCEQRAVSTIAPQALTFLNGEFAQQQAKRFAARLRQDAGPGSAAQVRWAFQLAFCRPPSPSELAASLDFLMKQENQIAAEAGEGANRAETRQRARKSFCLVILNANEFFYLQ